MGYKAACNIKVDRRHYSAGQPFDGSEERIEELLSKGLIVKDGKEEVQEPVSTPSISEDEKPKKKKKAKE